MSSIARRQFLKSTVAATTCASLAAAPATLAGSAYRREKVPSRLPVFVATWNFGQAVGDQALAAVQQGGSMLDAIESGIRVCEADADNGSVGIGGTPNADGVVQLDAVIMSGPGHRAGSVGGLEGIAHPISVARSVMEKTDHVLLVGDGAKKFAIEQGHRMVDLLTPNREQAWRKWKSGREEPVPVENNHDTITLIGVNSTGEVFGGCSTSGRGYKLAGRVGDSPIVGSGLYVDNTVGAAGATGIGENVMRYCGSFLIVEFMRNGLSPENACLKTIERIADLDPLGFDKLAINFIAVNRDGEYGAAGTSKGFEFAVVDDESSQVHPAKIVAGP